MKGQKAMQNIIVFISSNTFGVGGTDRKALKHLESSQRIRGSKHNFELYQTAGIYSNHKIWCIFKPITCIYIIYNKKKITKRTLSALQLFLFRYVRNSSNHNFNESKSINKKSDTKLKHLLYCTLSTTLN